MRKIKQEKGSMAVYVSIVLLSMLFILMAVFITSNAVMKSQIETIIGIKQSYEADNDRADEIYDRLTGNSNNNPSYVSNGLVLHYDAINNTGSGHSSTTTTWKDLSGNGNDGTLLGFDSNSGWQDNFIKFDGVNDYILSKNNLGLSGDCPLSMCVVAAWDGDEWISGNWPSYMGIDYCNDYNGLSMTMNDGKPALDFWNYRYMSNTALSVKQIYQICLTKEPGAINTTSKIYVNGQEIVGTGNSTNPIDIVDAKAVIGRLDANRWANARIYNVKYYNKALTSSEIQENYKTDKERYNINT